MKQNDDETETVIAKGHHVDGCVCRNGRSVVVTVENGVIDVTAKMKQFGKDRATHQDHCKDLPSHLERNSCSFLGDHWEQLYWYDQDPSYISCVQQSKNCVCW